LLRLAVLLSLRRGKPTAERCVLAGLLVVGAALTRRNEAAEMVAVLAVLVIQRVCWRAVTAAAMAFAVPVLAYIGGSPQATATLRSPTATACSRGHAPCPLPN
jgi:hypothetical protein